MLTCDVCGNTRNVQTRTFGLDGKAYELTFAPKTEKTWARSPPDTSRKPATPLQGRASGVAAGGRAPRCSRKAAGRAPKVQQEKGICLRTAGSKPHTPDLVWSRALGADERAEQNPFEGGES